MEFSIKKARSFWGGLVSLAIMRHKGMLSQICARKTWILTQKNRQELGGLEWLSFVLLTLER
jgi:hypothetical protein